MAHIECIRGAFNESSDFFGTPDLWSASSFLVKDGRTLYVIDSGIGPQIRGRILETIGKLSGIEEAYILNTHGHSDHSANSGIVRDLKQRFKSARCLTHEGGKEDTEFFLKYVPLIGKPMQDGLAHTEWLKEMDATQFDFKGVSFKGWKADGALVLSTPGHSPDSVAIYIPGAHALFTGDGLWFVSPNNPRGDIGPLLQNAGKLKTLAASEHIDYLGEGHLAPIIGEEAVLKQIASFEERTRALIAGIEQAVAGEERITIEGCLGKLKKSGDPAVKEALAINFPFLPSYTDTFISVLLREKGWQRIDRNQGGTWVAPGKK